ncbi:OsmC-like protein [Hypoxylon argillaceum]|nr:OsmC-like protein [Hypoxylon argillaceum]
MASAHSLRPLLATARRVPRPVTILAAERVIGKRLLNTDTAPILYSAHAKVKGARTGHVEGDDLRVALTMAKALGGKGDKGKTNPEELFAAGYGACFQSAMNAVAASMGTKMPTNPEDSVVATTVHLVGDMKKLDMGIRVDMKVSIRGLEKGTAEKIVERAKEVCPYSRATRGNVTTNVEVVTL